jgi:hypothetical protein
MAVHEFNKLMPQASPYSLLDWYEFKKLNRSIFLGMYQMWFKKID